MVARFPPRARVSSRENASSSCGGALCASLSEARRVNPNFSLSRSTPPSAAPSGSPTPVPSAVCGDETLEAWGSMTPGVRVGYLSRVCLDARVSFGVFRSRGRFRGRLRQLERGRGPHTQRPFLRGLRRERVRLSLSLSLESWRRDLDDRFVLFDRVTSRINPKHAIHALVCES